MKAVSALRVKRGLPRVSGAEPPMEAVPQLTDTNPNNQEQLSNLERKANTMKTYILRDPEPVEPQKSIRPPRRKLVVPATPVTVVERPVVTAKNPVLFIGLDVHNDSIAVSLAPAPSACSAGIGSPMPVRRLASTSSWRTRYISRPFTAAKTITTGLTPRKSPICCAPT